MSPPDDAPVDLVDVLTFEIASLFFRMREAARVHVGQVRLSAGRRSILRSIALEGPQTVPEMARVRGLSRQRVQTLVDSLLNDQLVTRIDNPGHKRSKLVALTPQGESLFSTMREREKELFERLSEGLSEGELLQTLRVVRTLKDRLDSDSPATHRDETRRESDS